MVDEKGKPIAGANVFVEGSYDGATTNETGDFSFETGAKGNQTLVVSFLIYETLKTEIDVASFQGKTIKLKDNMNALDTVVITAGTMESGEKARKKMLVNTFDEN